MAGPRHASSGDGVADNDRRLSDLMRLAQEGDRAAYAELLSEVALLLRKLVQRRSPYLQPTDVEDIVQETLVSLHVGRATYDPERPFVPWLMGISRNRMADAARRYAKRTAWEVNDDHLLETFLDRDANMGMNLYGDPDALHQAIHELPQGQRKAVELLKLRELSLKEASAATGMSIGALKVAVHRAMKTLRAVLSNET